MQQNIQRLILVLREKFLGKVVQVVSKNTEEYKLVLHHELSLKTFYVSLQTFTIYYVNVNNEGKEKLINKTPSMFWKIHFWIHHY